MECSSKQPVIASSLGHQAARCSWQIAEQAQANAAQQGRLKCQNAVHAEMIHVAVRFVLPGRVMSVMTTAWTSALPADAMGVFSAEIAQMAGRDAPFVRHLCPDALSWYALRSGRMDPGCTQPDADDDQLLLAC